MKRLTEHTIPETGFSVVSEEKYKRILMEEKPSVEKVYNRLKKIEDILGDEYDLDELKEVVQAKREGRCVVFAQGYPIVSEYAPKDEDGLHTKAVTGVISEEEYQSALRMGQEDT